MTGVLKELRDRKYLLWMGGYWPSLEKEQPLNHTGLARRLAELNVVSKAWGSRLRSCDPQALFNSLGSPDHGAWYVVRYSTTQHTSWLVQQSETTKAKLGRNAGQSRVVVDALAT